MSFFRYVGIQILAYAVDLLIFIVILKFLFWGVYIANISGKLTAGYFAFIAHRRYTFRSNLIADRNHQALRYFALLVINVPLSSVVLFVVLNWIDHPLGCKILVDFVSVGVTYLLSKFFVFVEGSSDLIQHSTSQESGK